MPRRIPKASKGISTILAALLMVVIVVVSAVLVYAWSTGLLGSLLAKPTVAQESLVLEQVQFAPTNDNVTVYLRNAGKLSSLLVSYYVKDNNGNQYSRISWAGPTINPNAVSPANLPISNACNGCTPQGSAFTFAPGISYQIIIITSRNSRFVFQINR